MLLCLGSFNVDLAAPAISQCHWYGFLGQPMSSVWPLGACRVDVKVFGISQCQSYDFLDSCVDVDLIAKLGSEHLGLMNTGGGPTLVTETRVPAMGSLVARFNVPWFDEHGWSSNTCE